MTAYESPEERRQRAGIVEVPLPGKSAKKLNGGSHPTGSPPAADAPTDKPELRKNASPRGPKGVFHGTFLRGVPVEHPGKTEYIPAYRRELKVLDAAQLLTMKVPPRNLIMSPWLPEKGLAMIFALRGLGKTWAALGVGHAVASGGQFLRWSAKSPRRVLYIDGEMPMALLKERYAMVVASAMTEAPPQNFRMLAADYQQDGLPDFSDPEAQKFYEGVVADADLIILDITQRSRADLKRTMPIVLALSKAGYWPRERRGDPSWLSIMPAKVGASGERRRRKTPSIR
jgi:hypothetical protein